MNETAVLTVLTEVLTASAAVLPGNSDRRVTGWLDAAERLLLDERAEPRALVVLALSAGGTVLECLERHPPATAASIQAVLDGWRDAQMPGTGQPANEPPGGLGAPAVAQGAAEPVDPSARGVLRCRRHWPGLAPGQIRARASAA